VFFEFGLAMWVIKMFLFVDFVLIIELVVCLQIALLNIVLSLKLASLINFIYRNINLSFDLNHSN